MASITNSIFQYMEWRGDLSFSASPFQAVDSLILCCLSYIRLQPIEELVQDIPLTDLAKAFQQLPEEQRKKRVQEDEELLYYLASSIRFGNMLVTHYVDHIDPMQEKQFSAMTFLLDDDTLFIAFRGTDNTLVGWKEDFNMTFMSEVPAQLEAVAYLQKIATLYPDKKILLGGHSKGGNLAVYAAAYCREAVQDRILSIYNHDGPGFHHDIITSPQYQNICERIHTYVPQSSVVGMLMEHEEAYTVIKSSQISLWQHDPYSWNLMGPNFLQVESVDLGSRMFDAAMKSWLSQLETEQRAAFVDTLFQILSTTNASSFKEMNENRMRTSAAILKALRLSDKETRKIITNGISVLFSSVMAAIETTWQKEEHTSIS